MSRKAASGTSKAQVIKLSPSLFTNLLTKGLNHVNTKHSGLTKIKDNNLAQKLLDKTMKMNKTIGIQAVATTLVLGLLPELFNK